MGLPATLAHHGVARLIIAEILLPQARCGNETVGAGFIEFDEKPGARDPADPALKGGAYSVGEKMRDQTITGLSFGRHRPAFRGRNTGRNLAQRADVLMR